MNLSSKVKKTPKEHKILLLLSSLVVTSSLYALLQDYSLLILPNETKVKVKERVLALVINSAPKKTEVVERQEVTKEILKQKPIEKPKKITKAIKKEIVEKEVIKEEIVEEVVEQKIVQNKAESKEEIVQEFELVEKASFDEKAKESFIAGLYEILNENKHYPKMAKRRKLEGVCEVSFTLSKDGKLRDISLKEACGHSILDKAALEVVRSIEFYKPIPDSVSLGSLHLNIPIKYARN